MANTAAAVAAGTLGIKQKTILGYDLTSQQDIYLNYFLPTVAACVLYILQFSSDLVLTYRHFSDGNPIWASLTLFFMYLPALGCFIITISSWELWPEYEGCGMSNINWAILKVLQHTFYPVWSMWRYAEKIFWSIEAIRSEDEESKEDALKTVTAARTIELYFFLQGYLQAVPQILLQLHILMRNVNDMEQQTVDVQVMTLITNLTKMSVTTTLYQRFKSQKLGGKQYPWLKPYKLPYYTRSDQQTQSNVAVEETDEQRPSSSYLLERRRSSDFYLEPNEMLQDKSNKIAVVPTIRETSVVDGPQRIVYRELPADEVDIFGIPRLRDIKALPEDDVAGKTIAFFWWWCFLLGRMLTISAFAYFYPTDIIWLLASHFILVVSLLLYDVRADEVRRAKAIFFIFIGLVYLFCLIEFKIKFKKAKFIYYGFFLLMFTENIVMCSVWWFGNVETIENDFWYRYIFCVIWGSTGLSIVSMLFYLRINKPEKVVVGKEIVK